MTEQYTPFDPIDQAQRVERPAHQIEMNAVLRAEAQYKAGTEARRQRELADGLSRLDDDFQRTLVTVLLDALVATRSMLANPNGAFGHRGSQEAKQYDAAGDVLRVAEARLRDFLKPKAAK
jgi:hypothetical protein